MRITSELQRNDVIYRRVDDDFLDPLTFLSDSTDAAERGNRDPLILLQTLNTQPYRAFDYVKQSTTPPADRRGS